MKSITLIVLSVCLFASGVCAKTFTVNAAPPNQDRFAEILSLNAQMMPGDVMQFEAGSFPLSKQVQLRVGCTYLGRGPAASTIVNRFRGYAVRIIGSNTTIKALGFDGAGVELDSGQTPINRLLIDNCKFAVRNLGDPAWCGILSQWNAGRPDLLQDATVSNCTFGPIEGQAGIYAYDFRRLAITGCEFVDGTNPAADGVHITAHGASEDLQIVKNYGRDLRRNFLEIQGASARPTVQDNWYEWKGLIGFQPNDGTFAYSLPWEGSTDPKVLRNVSLIPKSSSFPDGIGVRIVFEVGGTNLLMEGNLGDGGNHILAANGARGSGVVRHNRFLNYREGPRNENLNTTTYEDNGPNTVLAVDLLTRGRPYPNIGFSALSTTPGTLPSEMVLKAQFDEMVSSRDALQHQLDASKAQLDATTSERDALRAKVNRAAAVLNGN